MTAGGEHLAAGRDGRIVTPTRKRQTAMDFAYIISALPDLMSGLKVTLIVSALAILFSVAIGAAGAALRTSGF